MIFLLLRFYLENHFCNKNVNGKYILVCKIDNNGTYIYTHTFVFIFNFRHKIIKAESKTINFPGLGSIDNQYCK